MPSAKKLEIGLVIHWTVFFIPASIILKRKPSSFKESSPFKQPRQGRSPHAMIVRHPNAISLPSFLLPSLSRPLPPIHHLIPLSKPHHPTRLLHRKSQIAASHIPSPTPFVPDARTFLSLIGRNLSQHAAKIPTWTDLFSYTSQQLREAGVEPARTRRYLLWWRDRFRKGVHGVGGDLTYVSGDGDKTAVLKMVEVPLEEKDLLAKEGLLKAKRVVVNVPSRQGEEKVVGGEGLRVVEGMKVRGARTIVGPYVQYVKGTGGSVAVIKAQEGMWEERRGVKVDGGERRKKMVRRNRLLAERKAARK